MAHIQDPFAPNAPLSNLLVRGAMGGSDLSGGLNFPGMGLWNPDDSNWYLRPLRMRLTPGGLTVQLLRRVFTAPLSITQQGVLMDNRFDPATPDQLAVGRVATEDYGAVPGTGSLGESWTNRETFGAGWWDFDGLVYIPPGQGLMLVCATATTPCHLTVQWLEERIPR